MSPQQQATEWVRGHLDAVVVMDDGDAWRIETTTSDGAVVLLRRADDEGAHVAPARVAPAEAVRRAYLTSNS